MVVALVRPLATIRLGELDAMTVKVIHRTDVNPVCTDDFHVFPDLFAHPPRLSAR